MPSRLDRRNGQCLICMHDKPVRNIDLYVIGSEGLNACHDCEMELVRHVQARMSEFRETRKQQFLARRAQEKANAVQS